MVCSMVHDRDCIFRQSMWGCLGRVMHWSGPATADILKVTTGKQGIEILALAMPLLVEHSLVGW